MTRIYKNTAALQSLLLLAIVMFLFFLLGDVANASEAQSAAGTSLPWEGPLKKLGDSITGPVAFGLSIMGLVAGGCALIFGGEIGEFIKRLVYLVLVISIMVFAKNLLSSSLFSGALVPDDYLALFAGRWGVC